jgi:lysine-ketoglutarate reductase/saccharopine dehydrogenase-like protein (TIGR00300 family)
MPKNVVAVFRAKGHLIDSGLMSDAMEAVQAAGATYNVLRLEIGKQRTDESELELEVISPSQKIYERVRADLMSLGINETNTEDCKLDTVDIAGTAPEGFYSTTNLVTEVHVAGQWILVEKQRMDAAVVVADGRARCVKLRDLQTGERIVTGYDGVRVTAQTTRKLQESKFGFMQGGASSERRVAAQVDQVVRTWRQVRAEGRKVILVAGPVIIHVGAAATLASILRAGHVDGLLSGNALAVHDAESAMFGTSLGVDQKTGAPSVHGHMHHMRAINRIRRAGGLQQAVEKKLLKNGVMHAAITAKVPFCLAGSIRDDGPLPDTVMDLIAAQARYAEILEGAGLVVILGSMLHGIGTGNMIAADVQTVCVDIHPAVVAKLSDRGSAQSQGIVTDVGGFLTALQQALSEPAPS